MNAIDRIIVSLGALLLALSVAVSLSHADSTVITGPSRYSVSETIDRIGKAVTDNGMTLFARINHAEEARKAGLPMLPMELLIFRNPKGGTALMVERPTVGIDLPMKALAWEDQTGRVWLSYNTPSLLHVRHGLPEDSAARLDPVGKLLELAVE